MKIGDAPSQYFFKLMQAKRIIEAIRVLRTLDGRTTEDKEEIFGEVFNHCRSLYTKDHYVNLYKDKQDEVLSLINKKLIDEDNQELKEVPNKYEITIVVFGFPSRKSSDGDGVTYDFLQHSWDLFGECCVAMVQEF